MGTRERFYSNDPAGFSTDNPFSFNRYAYANNNPYKFVDPDGRDAVFSVDPKGAHDNGHTILYFQDGKGTWNAYDQGAARADNLMYLIGKNLPASVSIEPVDASKVPSDGFRIKTTRMQDFKIASSAKKSMNAHNSGKIEYNLYSNNCTDAGITISNPATTVRPISWIDEVKSNPDAVEVRRNE